MENVRETERAAQVQATLEQIERQLSHRCEPQELAFVRKRLERIRAYIQSRVRKRTARRPCSLHLRRCRGTP
jgi:hypothetical protein